MPAAPVGPENPLPPLKPARTLSGAVAGAPGETVRAQLLPYRLQDGYGRERRGRGFRVAVLENDHLRATFLLEQGGRLWSLVDKADGGELLFRNPVFQPANLALRDAWFAGGVEWNVSIIGHCPFTCAPLFAGRVAGAEAVLRLYEYERVRGVVFQLDFALPADSRQLLVAGRIRNPGTAGVPMYWWSNTAVAERPGVRIVAPADEARRHVYDGRLVTHGLPALAGEDVTYPAARPHASDLYFVVPPGTRPWIAALDAAGRGLLHASTTHLSGRKAFNWGRAPGGRQWQEWLAQPGEAYFEIQAGVAPTQSEYVVLPAGAQWEWIEAYGPVACDPARVHGGWAEARAEVSAALERLLPAARMEERFRDMRAGLDRPVAELFQAGSGWGALEEERRRSAGEPPLVGAATPFPTGTLGPEQQPWRELLRTGELPGRPAAAEPGAFEVGAAWRHRLEQALAHGRGDHWLSWLHLGVMRYVAGEERAAAEAWRTSLAREASAWACRNLAVVASDPAAAVELYRTACRLQPALLPLAVEAGEAMLRAGRGEELASFVAALPPALQADPRCRYLAAAAALGCDRLDDVARFFAGDPRIPNQREGENLLTDLWRRWQERRLILAGDDPARAAARVRSEGEVPEKIDFRMTAE